MRAATTRPAMTPSLGGIALLISGVALVALSIAILLRSGGGVTSSPAAGPIVDPLAATNGTVAFWEERHRADPADFTAANRLASAYIQRGRETGDVSDFTRAQAAVDVSLASLPGDNYGGYSTLAYLQGVRHDFAASLETALHAQTLKASDPYATSIVGDSLLALGRYDEAFDVYAGLVEESPDVSTFSRMAQIYEIRGDLPNAEAAWNNALDLDSGLNAETTAWAHSNFGTFLFNQGRLDEAASQYDEALSAYPGYIHPLAGQASVAAAEGDYASAIALYTGVAQRQPLPQYVAALGDVYAASGDQANADRQYALINAIVALYEENGVNVDLQIANFYADHDTNIDSAVQQALAVKEAQPASIYATDAVAWALYKDGRPDEALAYAEEALAEGTQDVTLFYHAGLIHRALGNDDLAREHLRTALDINPHFSPLQAPIAQQALAELGG